MSNRKPSIHSVGIVATIAVEVAVAIFLQGLDGISDALGPFGTLLARSVGWGIAVSFGVYLVVALRHLWNGDNGIDDDVRLRYELEKAEYMSTLKTYIDRCSAIHRLQMSSLDLRSLEMIRDLPELQAHIARKTTEFRRSYAEIAQKLRDKDNIFLPEYTDRGTAYKQLENASDSLSELRKLSQPPEKPAKSSPRRLKWFSRKGSSIESDSALEG